MIKMKFIWALIAWVTLLHAQPAQHSYQTLLEDFETEYSALGIPNLELSYVNNLKNVGSEAELNAQEEFFQKYQQRLKQHSNDDFSEKDRVTYQVLMYEIELNLDRIKLEKKWVEGDYGIRSTRIFDESLGKQWYPYFLKKWIDKDLTPDAAYEFGLQEIEKVKSRMADIKKRMKLDDAAFKKQWENPQYLISEEEEVLEKYNDLKWKVRDKAKRYFPDVDKVPPVQIEAGTNEAMAIAPAYYNNNTFYFNFFDDTYDSREMGWIFMHEAIPGHHYQHHIAARHNGSSVRQLFFYMGYVEGWGAYIEQFGRELGVYRTPFDAYAQLEWDLIRSVRVALDVGLNYYGWSDEQAMEFWNQHIADKEDIARREIKRMKRWPAQVITYKYGKHILDELKGDKYTPEDLKPFHQQVLEYGDLPLSVLRSHILQKQKQGATSELDSTSDLFQAMKAKNDKKWYQHFTFKQSTIRFDENGIQTDSAVWYESVSYPYYFRIDRDIENNHYVIFRNDSTYNFNQDTLVKAVDKPATHLLFKGGLYFISLEESLEKLKKYNYDVQAFRKDTFNSQPVYVVGKEDNQFWLNARDFYCMRRIYTTPSNKKVDVVYDNFKTLGNGWVEQKVTFYVEGVKRLEEFYFDIEASNPVDERTYDINQNYKWYMK
jgi:hypothetical protein